MCNSQLVKHHPYTQNSMRNSSYNSISGAPRPHTLIHKSNVGFLDFPIDESGPECNHALATTSAESSSESDIGLYSL